MICIAGWFVVFFFSAAKETSQLPSSFTEIWNIFSFNNHISLCHITHHSRVCSFISKTVEIYFWGIYFSRIRLGFHNIIWSSTEHWTVKSLWSPYNSKVLNGQRRWRSRLFSSLNRPRIYFGKSSKSFVPTSFSQYRLEKFRLIVLHLDSPVFLP